MLDGSVSERDGDEALGYRLGATHMAYVLWSDELGEPEIEKVAPSILRSFDTWQHLHSSADDGTVEGWVSVREQRPEHIETLARGVTRPNRYGSPSVRP